MISPLKLAGGYLSNENSMAYKKMNLISFSLISQFFTIHVYLLQIMWKIWLWVFTLILCTLDSEINVGVRLLILWLFSSGYVLIKGGTFINFFKKIFNTFFPLAICIRKSNYLLF